MKPIYLDTETTGLSQNDEIVEIAMLDDDGKVLLDTLVRPVHHAEWPDAQAVHGITPEMVKDAPTLDDLRENIVEIVRGRDVVIYNVAYDSQYLHSELSAAASISCCMFVYAEFRGEWSDYWENYRWHKLTDAAAAVLHEWQGDCHRALADCHATRAVWRYLTDPDEQRRVDGIKADREAETEAERQLFWLHNREKAKREQFQREMSVKWMKRWGFFRETLSFHEKIAKGLEYYQVFTGMKKEIWLKYRKYHDTVPMVESLKDIPGYYISQKDVSDLPPHLQNSMKPCAFYLSKSRKTFRLFYDRRDLTKLRRKFRRRKYQVYESYDDVPDGLMSKSQWKQRGVDVEKENMKPVAEYFFRCQHGNRYVLLYRIPPNEEES